MVHLLRKASFIGGSLVALWCATLSMSAAKPALHSMPSGFDDDLIQSVVSVQNLAHDEDYVVLRGRLTNYLRKDRYEFTDESGDSIEVELDDDLDWSGIYKDQLILIMGEVERNMFKIHIEAFDFRALEPPFHGQGVHSPSNAEVLHAKQIQTPPTQVAAPAPAMANTQAIQVASDSAVKHSNKVDLSSSQTIQVIEPSAGASLVPESNGISMQNVASETVDASSTSVSPHNSDNTASMGDIKTSTALHAQ